MEKNDEKIKKIKKFKKYINKKKINALPVDQYQAQVIEKLTPGQET